MDNPEQIPATPKLRAVHQDSDITKLWSIWMNSVAPSSQIKYTSVIRLFARHMGHGDDIHAMIQELLPMSLLDMTEVIGKWKAEMISKNRAGSTINMKILVLESLLTQAEAVELIRKVPKVKGVKATPVRDVAGPGAEGLKMLLRTAKDQKPSNFAIICLLCMHGLRRNEVSSLRVGDYDPPTESADDGRGFARLCLHRKGKHDREFIRLVPMVSRAIDEHLKSRNAQPSDPLFIGLRGDGITGHGIWRLVKRIGDLCGINVHPHAIRHTSATLAMIAAAEKGLPVQEVMKHTGHKNAESLTKYYDFVKGSQLHLALSVAQALEGYKEYKNHGKP